MDLDSLVGAQLVVGIPGTEATSDVIAHLRSVHARHLILFARNYESPEQVKRLIDDLERGLGRRLNVMVDQEGGRVARFRTGVTHFPDAMTMATQGPAAVEEQGRIEARELSALGINVNLAPCLDVLAAGSDPIIGNRSYGADAAVVAACGLARIRGLQEGGLAACAKHFPGLGAVPRDPHVTLPTVRLGWNAMEATHLPPFAAALRAGVATVMTSHVCYPALGEPEGLPATFSPRLVQDLLRKRFHFPGLVLTDDMEMGALRSLGSFGELALRAVQAGHDLVLVCSKFKLQTIAYQSLRENYGRSILSLEALQQTHDRIDRFLPAKVPTSA